MALPTSGTISLQDVNVELGNSSTALISLNDTDVRTLAGIPSGQISMDDLYGSSAGGSTWFQLMVPSESPGVRQVWINDVVVSGSSIYVVGRTDDTTSNFFGSYQIKLATSTGSVTWQRVAYPSSSAVYAYGCDIDSIGNLYIWSFYGLGGGYLLKYNSSGVLQWQKNISDINAGWSRMAIDGSDNIYVCGTNTSSAGGMVVKFDTSGNVVWQRRLGSTGDDFAGVDIDSSGNVYVAGETSTGNRDVLLAKYNASGTLQWQRSFGTTGSIEDAEDLVVDSSGNSYIITQNGVVIKYNTSGTLQWQKKLTMAGVTSGPFGRSIALDSNGDIYITAYYIPTAVFSYIGILCKLDTSGNMVWSRQLSSTSYSFIYPFGVAVSGSTIYVTGAAATALVFGFQRGLIMSVPTDGSGAGTYSDTTYGDVVYGSAFVSALNYTGVSTTTTLTSQTTTETVSNGLLTDEAATVTRVPLT